MSYRTRKISGQDALETMCKAFDNHNQEAAGRRKARLAKVEKVRVKPVAKVVKNSAWKKEFDKNMAEINETLAKLRPQDFGEHLDVPMPEPMAVPIGDVLGCESLGTQTARLAKTEKDVILYGSLTTVGLIQEAEAQAKGGNVMKADAAEAGIDLCKIYI